VLNCNVLRQKTANAPRKRLNAPTIDLTLQAVASDLGNLFVQSLESRNTLKQNNLRKKKPLFRLLRFSLVSRCKPGIYKKHDEKAQQKRPKRLETILDPYFWPVFRIQKKEPK
jgi:hypothetical protein